MLLQIRPSYMRRLGFAFAAATVVVTSACSSSGAKSNSAPGGSVGSKATKSAFVLYSVQDDAGNNRAFITGGATAAVDSINAAGGVDGHPIKIVYCDTQNDPNVAAQCGRTAVANPSVVAMTSDSTSFNSNVDAVLERAGVPVVGGIPFSQGEFTSKVAFNTTPGALSTPAEGIIIVKQLHGKKIGVPYVGVPAGAGIKPLTQAIVGPIGGTVVGNIAIPINAADVTTQAAAEAAAKPDGILDALNAPQMIEFIKAYRQQGGTTPFVVGANELGAQAVAKQLAGFNQDIYAAGWFDYASSGYQKYMADMKKFQPNALDPTNDLTTAGWLNVELFAMASAKAIKSNSNGRLTRAGLLSTMNSYTNFNLGGITPTIDFAKTQTALGGNFSRIVNPYYYPWQFKNGKYVSLDGDKPLNLFKGGA